MALIVGMSGSGSAALARQLASQPAISSRRQLSGTTKVLDANRDSVRPLVASLPSKYPYREPELQVDHLVIGAGVVGLSIAAALASRWPEKTTFVAERHKRAGEETSSRNSEVIHSGIHYPRDSLKTRFCLEGRELLYQRCKDWGVPYCQTGKLTVGDAESLPKLESVARHIQTLGPLAPEAVLLSGDQAREMEPDLGPSIKHALLTPRTGIVSSHELMESLEREIVDAGNGELVYDTRIVRVDPHVPSTPGSKGGKRGADNSQEGWVVQTLTSEVDAQPDALLARVVINASGLNGQLVLNSLLDKESQESSLSKGQEPKIPKYYLKGNYASYKGPGVKNVQRLIYPLPFTTSKDSHGHSGLGTHLTLDLDGGIRFGPDSIQWLSPPVDATPEEAIDFWSAHMAVPDSILSSMHDSITQYLPEITLDGLSPDYSGIRPKLAGPGDGFRDFELLWHNSRNLEHQKVWQRLTDVEHETGGPDGWLSKSESRSGVRPGLSPMVSLLGIESPGLTSALAIGQYVARFIATAVWEGTGKRASKNKGAHNEESGELDAWA